MRVEADVVLAAVEHEHVPVQLHDVAGDPTLGDVGGRALRHQPCDIRITSVGLLVVDEIGLCETALTLALCDASLEHKLNTNLLCCDIMKS